MSITQKRSTTYIIAAFGLILGYAILCGHPWRGSMQLHTVMEVIATLLAATVGAMALVRA